MGRCDRVCMLDAQCTDCLSSHDLKWPSRDLNGFQGSAKDSAIASACWMQRPEMRTHPEKHTFWRRMLAGSVWRKQGHVTLAVLAGHAGEKCVEEARLTRVVVIMPLKISGPWFLSCWVRVLNRVAAPAGRPHDGLKPAPKPHVEPVTPTSVTGEGHGSMFFTSVPPCKMLDVSPQWRGLGGGNLPRLVTPQGGRRILHVFA